MEDNIRKYEETIERLMQQLRTVCQERDKARHQLQVLLTKLQPCASKKPSSMSTEPCSDLSCKSSSSSSFSTSHYCHLSLAGGRTKGSADYVAPSRGINDMVDRLVCGRPLPQKGRLLRTVTEAGPLLHTLLLAPLPQWRNPPPLEDDDCNDKLVDDVIPTTSLSLAFHGNSRMSSPPTLDVVHPNDDRDFTGKKRRFM